MKYSFIIPYYRRLEQFRNTLSSLRYQYHDRDDFELIVVEDAKSGDTGELDALLGAWGHLRIRKIKRENGFNPAPLYNAGAIEALGDVLVLTNPECLHIDNVLAEFDRLLPMGRYIVAKCRHITKTGRFYLPSNFGYQEGKWLCHPSTSPSGGSRYHYCSAIPFAVYQKIRGFDERYADGIAAEDNDFRDRAIKAMKGYLYTEAVVLHQEHTKPRDELPVAEWRKLVDKNRNLYYKTKKKK